MLESQSYQNTTADSTHELGQKKLPSNEGNIQDHGRRLLPEARGKFGTAIRFKDQLTNPVESRRDPRGTADHSRASADPLSQARSLNPSGRPIQIYEARALNSPATISIYPEASGGRAAPVKGRSKLAGIIRIQLLLDQIRIQIAK
jgi:hypothetical protein